jgi:hypothetical protein
METNQKTPDLLIISSEVLVVLKSELEARGVKPTPENLRWVMEVIEKSLPTFSSEFFV